MARDPGPNAECTRSASGAVDVHVSSRARIPGSKPLSHCEEATDVDL